MDRPAFERYLKLKLGLMGKTVSDVASRCARVEKAFGLNLDEVVAANQLPSLIDRVKSSEGRKRMDYVGADKKWYASVVIALKKYSRFRGEEQHLS